MIRRLLLGLGWSLLLASGAGALFGMARATANGDATWFIMALVCLVGAHFAKKSKAKQ